MIKVRKTVYIVGPTASGKTALGVRLAARFGGEIISADSRQVYRGMDIGTGKDLHEFKVQNSKFKSKEEFIKYHLINVVGPKTEYNLAKWLRAARRARVDIWERGKLPIVVGGTGLWAQALASGLELSAVRPDKELRAMLNQLNATALFKKLKKLSPVTAKELNRSEQGNKQRLIRRIEKAMAGRGREGREGLEEREGREGLILGIRPSLEVIDRKIQKRLIERLEKEDMVGEAFRLHEEGVSWKRLESFGLEYKYLTLYLKGELSYAAMVESLARAIRQYARRQLSWLRRWERMGGKIVWVSGHSEAEIVIKRFLRNSL